MVDISQTGSGPKLPAIGLEALTRLGTESLQTRRWRRQSGANSSLKRRPGDRAVNPGGGDRRRKELTGIFERYKKGMTWSHSPESWPFLRRTRPSSFWSRVQKLGQNSYSGLANHKIFQWFMRKFPTYRKRVFISAKWGVGKVASGDFSTWIRGSRISVQALGLGARDHRFRPDPGGRS